MKLYEEGDCFKNVNPYDGEPEYMVTEVHAKGHESCYSVIALYGDGQAGQRCIMPHKEVHSINYEKQK